MAISAPPHPGALSSGGTGDADSDAQALFEEARRRRRRRWTLGVVIITVVATTVTSLSLTGGGTGRRVAHRTAGAPHVASAPLPAPPSVTPDPPCGSSTPVGAVNSIDFVDADDGFGFTLVPALAAPLRGDNYDELVTTHDAGANWVPVCPPSGRSVFSGGYLAVEPESGRDSYPSQDLLFTTTTDGYLWGPSGVARTTDGGTTWTVTLTGDVNDLAASSGRLWAAMMMCPPLAFNAAKCHSDLRVSRDGGRSWSVVRGTAATGDDATAVTTGTTHTIVAADLRSIDESRGPIPGQLLVSTDNGTSFRSRSFTCPPYTTSVQIAAAGPADALWLTCSGGVAESAWLAVSRATDLTAALLPVSASAVSPAVGYPGTLPGLQPQQLVVTSATDATVLMGFTTRDYPLPAGLYQTDDGGRSWSPTWPVTTAAEAALQGDIDFVTATDGWAAVSGDGPALLLQTTDGGRTWVAG
jgi:hypothetical protein